LNERPQVAFSDWSARELREALPNPRKLSVTTHDPEPSLIFPHSHPSMALIECPTCEFKSLHDPGDGPLLCPKKLLELASLKCTHRLPALLIDFRSSLSAELFLNAEKVETVHAPDVSNLKVQEIKKLLPGQPCERDWICLIHRYVPQPNAAKQEVRSDSRTLPGFSRARTKQKYPQSNVRVSGTRLA